jgi:hypothetical protein
MKATDAAWAAGFFEGEGCVSILYGRVRGDGFQSLHLRLSLNQCEPEPVQRLREMFGGSISMKKSKNIRHRDRWEWVVSGNQARAAFALIRPYFVSQTKCKRFVEIEKQIADNLLVEPFNEKALARKAAWA